MNKNTGLVVKGAREYLTSNEVMSRFVDVLGREAMPYVQGVILQVALSEKLQKCSIESVAQAAIEAAVLRLSVMPKMKQAYIVPFRRGNKGYVAELVIHYQGLYLLMERSGLYKGINVVAVYEGEEVYEDIASGLHSLLANGSQENTRARRVTRFHPRKVVGWLGFYERLSGVQKSVYMSVDEIEAHAKQYSKAYQKDIEKGWKMSNWSAPAGSRERQVQEMKTVLRRLAGFGEKAITGRSDYEQALQYVEVQSVPSVSVPSVAESLAEGERADEVRFDELYSPPVDDGVGYRYDSAEAVRIFGAVADLSPLESARKLKGLRKSGVVGEYAPASWLQVLAKRQGVRV